MKAARQKFEHGELFWYDHPDGGLIFAVAIDGWWDVYDDTGHLDPPVEVPEGLSKPERGFGKIWHENDLVDRLGWGVSLELPGEGDCEQDGENWELTFGSEFVAKLEPPAPEPEPESPPVGPPPPPAVPPPFAGWSRPPELVTFPSGEMRDMAFCTGATPADGGTLRTTWAYGYYITVDRKTGEITLRGETVKVFSGDDAIAFLIAWHMREGQLDIKEQLAAKLVGRDQNDKNGP